MNSTKKKINQDVYVAILLLIASVLLFINAKTKMSAEAAQFPILILGVFIILTVLLLIKGVQNTKAGNTENGHIEWGEVKMPFFMFLVILLYVVAVDVIGFIVPSIVFPIAAMWINFVRNKAVLIALPLGMVAFLYVLFTYILQTKLP
ncbi:MAG: tripartite tricarboxylate transporter TctB family protein [Stomatobaculum sp.]